jgi:hypothetical protein
VRFGRVPNVDGVDDEFGKLEDEDNDGGVDGDSSGACGGCTAGAWSGELVNLTWNVSLGIEVQSEQNLGTVSGSLVKNLELLSVLNFFHNSFS